MKLGDTHCDTLSRILNGGGDLFENSYHVSLKRAGIYDTYTQFFACFMSPGYYHAPKKYLKAMIDIYFDNMNRYKSIAVHCENYKDLQAAHESNRAACFLSVEGGEFVDSAEDIDYIRNRGVRLMSLAWDNDNELAGYRGLTAFGKDILGYMEKKGMFLDVSHLSDRGFYDACSLYSRPVFASHSNSRSVCDVKRNLTDEQFLYICKTGGYVGINLYPLFLTGTERATISDILRHIEHFLSLGGENHIGFGLDFDGIDFMPQEIGGIEDAGEIITEMNKLGYNQELIDKIAHKNLERALKIF